MIRRNICDTWVIFFSAIVKCIWKKIFEKSVDLITPVLIKTASIHKKRQKNLYSAFDPLNCLPPLHTVVPNVKNPPKISSPKVISWDFPCKFLKISTTSVSGCLCFTLKICQIVAGTIWSINFTILKKSHFWRAFAIWPNCAPVFAPN